MRVSKDHGFTIIEVMVAALILLAGSLGLLASLDAFRSTTSSMIGREAATHEAERQIEMLRAITYRRLVMNAAPGAPQGPKDPRTGVSGGSYRPSADTAAAPMVIDATAEGALPPSVPWSAGDTSGEVHRFITQEPAGTPGCGQICPKRVSVGVTFTVRGQLSSVVMSTLVADPQSGLADEANAPPAPKPATCPCWSTLYLYDTPATFASRQTPSTDHVLRARNDHPDLMAEEPPPNPFQNATSDPFEPPRFRYGTDLELTDGLGLTYPGGALIKESGGCNDDGDRKKTARWTTRPFLAGTTFSGDAAASIYTQFAGALSGQGSLCFTFYDWVIDANGKIGNKQKLLSWGFFKNPWPTGEPEQVDTGAFRFLANGATRTIAAGRALGVEITVFDGGPGTEAIFYDHPNLASLIQVASTPGL